MYERGKFEKKDANLLYRLEAFKKKCNKVYENLMGRSKKSILCLCCSFLDKMLLCLMDDLSTLGRTDFASLSQQTLLEIVVQDVANTTGFQDSSGDFLDITEWVGVVCDMKGEVTRINWYNQLKGGKIMLEWLPHTVENFRLQHCNVKGTLDTSTMPANISNVEILSSALHGTLCMRTLPININQFTVFGTSCDGLVELFDTLPSKIQLLSLGDNKLRGSIALDKLPDSLCYLRLNTNAFSGSICLTKLPENMQDIALHKNSFSGSVDLSYLPKELKWLTLSENQLNGGIDLSHLPKNIELLQLHRNELSGGLSLLGLPASVRCINLSQNTFVQKEIEIGGEVRFADLWVIDLSENDIKAAIDENGNIIQSEKVVINI